MGVVLNEMANGGERNVGGGDGEPDVSRLAATTGNPGF